MTAPIPPALSAEEWEKFQRWQKEDGSRWIADGYDSQLFHESASRIESPERQHHWVAALCLHGQDFGFTREDVDAVARAAAEIQSNLSRIPTDIASSFTATQSYAHYDAGMRHSRDAAILRSLAARINALLPPEGT